MTPGRMENLFAKVSAMISGLLAIPSVAAVGLWLMSAVNPEYLRRDDLITLYQSIIGASLASLALAFIWRLWLNESRHATWALLIALTALFCNCCGFFACFGVWLD